MRNEQTDLKTTQVQYKFQILKLWGGEVEMRAWAGDLNRKDIGFLK